ncbi:ABC transporter substrate-binding protein [Roseococcus sp. SDR]|uniref:ABC transporter substrate-binding protein n=1 Tax=Roseococcus sp. SDR TaxID=2835532 RepID=UPI001BD08F41|nr:ABC transporter substrate-binding protein [Roseococcus sp. SDR]MBS7791533.1 ABC transporter substrate-binding protein [Roseococcus sp. SDR]MBV1846847.1 ABC transporter substrate-binding protein [Roseococcus sp. SDR]
MPARIVIAAVAALGLAAGPAAAQGSLNLYCSVQVEWCQAAATQFQRETGIRVNMTQRGSGEMLAAIRAEAQNPRGDVWFGGTGDPHMAAAEENLTQAYESANNAGLQPWALTQWRQSERRSIGVYAGAVGFGFNTELLARRNIAAPACWADLLEPRFRGEVQMANPNSSGTAYVIIATLVQLMGEDQAFAYLRRLHPNVNSYTRSGTAPIKAVARGETAVSLSFVHDAVTERNAGFPVAWATPCEGTGFEIGSMSIIRGARNINQARRFYDWALTAPAQRLGFEVAGQLQTPSNREAPLPPGAPDLSQMRLIEYDFARYGRGAERRRLIEKWDREVGALPR